MVIDKKYIDLEEAVETLKHNSLKMFNSFYKGYTQAIKDLVDIPAADAAPVRHGRWIQCGKIVAYYECSECHHSIDQEKHYDYSDNIMMFPKYCEYCGAKMNSKDE